MTNTRIQRIRKKTVRSQEIPSYFLYQQNQKSSISQNNLIDFKLLSLLEISKNISQSENLLPMIHQSMSSLRKFFKADSLYIVLYNTGVEKNIFIFKKNIKTNNKRRLLFYKQSQQRIQNIQSIVSNKKDIGSFKYNNNEYFLLPLISQGQTLGVVFIKDFRVHTLNTLDKQILESIRDQIAMGCLNHQLKNLSSKDFLTDLYIRRIFDKDLKEQLNNLSEKNIFSLILLDIDFFKKVNDKYGHDTGDKVLKNFSKILESSVRENDIVYRIGGEEFAIILSETNQTMASKIAKRIQANLESNFIYDKLSITASFGVSEALQDDTVESIFKRSDNALYQSKRNGRNQITIENVS